MNSSPVSNPTSESSLLERLATFTSDNSTRGDLAIHRLHPYPAKYIPRLAREVIVEHTNERHLVLDPFCGSGTTLVEAAALRRRSIGIDSNPIAVMVSQAKSTPLSGRQIESIFRFQSRIDQIGFDYSDMRTTATNSEFVERWFQENVWVELTAIRNSISRIRDKDVRRFLLTVLSSIVVQCSNQDSETRYTAVAKDHADGYVRKRFESKLSTAIKAAAEFSELAETGRSQSEVIKSSTDLVGRDSVRTSSVDLIVTSPPYPNSFDYYLYHKLRMMLLGLDHKVAQKAEIGSRYEHSSRKAPVSVFADRMRPVMKNVARMLKPSKLAYFFVGDSVVQGEHINMQDLYQEITSGLSLELVGATEYSLANVSRSFRDTRNAAGGSGGHRHPKMQRVLVFERVNSSSERRHREGKSASPVPKSELTDLDGPVADGSVIAIRSSGASRHVHSMVGFPSKFFPELPAWAISEYSRQGEVVLDPFGGSGTTAVEAMISGRSAATIDVSPWAALVTTAKTRIIPPKTVVSAATKLTQALESGSLPVAQRMSFDLDDFWFNVDHLNDFASIRTFIETELPPQSQPFFLTSLASTIRSFSYQDPAQIKVKRDPKKVLRGTRDPRSLLLEKLPQLVDRYIEFIGMADPRTSTEVHCGSANSILSGGSMRHETYDLVVTSPPYINAMNYPMASRYELLLLGLVDEADLHSHQASYFGTERVYAKEYKPAQIVPGDWMCSDNLSPLISLIHEREAKRAYIALQFFVKMRETLMLSASRVRSGGHFVLVAGTNRIKDVPLDTFEILCSFLVESGLRRESSFHYEIVKQAFKITRHSTGSTIPLDGVGIFCKP